MAEDTREPEKTSQESTTSAIAPPKKHKYDLPKTQVGKLWEAFGNPEQPINEFSTAKYGKTGEKVEDVDLSKAIGTISMKDFANFYKAPCARDGLMYGLGAGFVAGGVRGVLGGLAKVWPACNWAVGTFAVVSIGAHEFCQRRRKQELEGMKQAVQMMAEIKKKKQKEAEEAKAAQAAREEEERRKKSWWNLANYKFW